MSVLDRLRKTSTIKETSILETSTFFNNRDKASTGIPTLDIALGGSLDGGLQAGLLQIAGPSKHFKSKIALEVAGAYMDKHEEACMLFYDSEFGSPKSYFASAGIDPNRVLHTPLLNIELMKHDIMTQLAELKHGDKVIIICDSLGNLASLKETEDALEGKSVADMTRAKQIKSLFRMVTPHLTMKDIPMIAVNHIYMTQEMYSKPVVSGGTGGYYSSNDIWIVGREQEKEGKEVTGYTFNINIEKSRCVREKSKIPLTVMFDGGIDKWSGMLDLAKESGHVIQSGAWYQTIDLETGEVSEKKVRSSDIGDEYFSKLVQNKEFKQFVEKKYMLVYDGE